MPDPIELIAPLIINTIKLRFFTVSDIDEKGEIFLVVGAITFFSLDNINGIISEMMRTKIVIVSDRKATLSLPAFIKCSYKRLAKREKNICPITEIAVKMAVNEPCFLGDTRE